MMPVRTVDTLTGLSCRVDEAYRMLLNELLALNGSEIEVADHFIVIQLKSGAFHFVGNSDVVTDEIIKRIKENNGT